MQEYGKLPASAYRAYTGLYVFCATRDHERPKPCRTALRAVHRVGMPPRLEGLRPSPRSIPTLRPVGLRQGSGTRTPPPRRTKPPAPRATRKMRCVAAGHQQYGAQALTVAFVKPERSEGVLVRRGGGVRVRRERRRRKSRCDAAHVARRSLRPRCGTAHQGCAATRLDAAGFCGRA